VIMLQTHTPKLHLNIFIQPDHPRSWQFKIQQHDVNTSCGI
jgi:hypothetical protein